MYARDEGGVLWQLRYELLLQLDVVVIRIKSHASIIIKCSFGEQFCSPGIAATYCGAIVGILTCWP